MTDQNAGKVLSALDDLVKVVDTWTAEVKAAVTKNLAAARTEGLTAGTFAEWSVQAVEMLMNGSLRVAGAVMDGATLFDDETPRNSTTVVTHVLVNNASVVPVPLHLDLIGNSTQYHVEPSRIVLSPSVATNGPTNVEVSVDVVGLPNDLYLGKLVGSANCDSQPKTVLIEHLTA